MSDLSIPSQAQGWVNDWCSYYDDRDPVFLARKLRHTATEQRANYLATERTRWKGSAGREKYKQSVLLLERAATEAEERAAAWEVEDALRKSEQAQKMETFIQKMAKKHTEQ